MSCKNLVNPDKLELYCKDTFKAYGTHYEWYPIPAEVHKMVVNFIPGCKRPTPIGLSEEVTSEEALESRIKDVKNYREHFTRKFSRKLTNEDVMKRSKKELNLPEEYLDLLL